jgi:hypothetical protein
VLSVSVLLSAWQALATSSSVGTIRSVDHFMGAFSFEKVASAFDYFS